MMHVQGPTTQTYRPRVRESVANRRREMVGDCDLRAGWIRSQRRSSRLVERRRKRPGFLVGSWIIVINGHVQSLSPERGPAVRIEPIPNEGCLLVRTGREGLVKVLSRHREVQVDRLQAGGHRGSTEPDRSRGRLSGHAVTAIV